MKNLKLVFCTLLLAPVLLFSQKKEVITLEQLQTLARENYPLLKQKKMYTDISGNKVKQLSSNFYPQISVTGQATYQSEVTELSIPIPGAGPGFQQKPDQYAVGLELKETLFDYGLVKTQKQIERENAEMQVQQVDADLIKLKERINSLYGNIYLQQENKKIMALRMAELDAKRLKMQSAVNNGAALQSNFLVLESEYLSTQQRIEEINSNLVAWFKTLSVFTNANLDTTIVFAEPASKADIRESIVRPEYKIFDLQSNSLTLREKSLNKTNLPKLFVFGRGYYGRPGYNFLNNDFRPYGMVGAGLNWNLSAYYTSSKEKTNLAINKDLISNQKKIFDMNLQATLIQQREEIAKLEKLIATDQRIVEAKTQVRKASSSQLDNGVITSSDYIVDLNAENQAQFNLKLHQIQLMMARENYNTTLGY